MADVNGYPIIFTLIAYHFSTPMKLDGLSSLQNAEFPAAVVIGGANLDFKSQTFDRPILGTSNPGRSRVSAGGVGRNVAENLARLGVDTALVTALGDDADGLRLVAETESAGVNLRHALTTRRPTGMYTALLDDAGEMVIAVSAMDGIDEITADVIGARRELISRAQILVLDCNVPVEALLLAAKTASENDVPVVVDPVSVAKAGRILAMLRAGHCLHTITPNLDELHALTGGDGTTEADLDSASALLHAMGAQQVWVRLGVRGSFLSAMQNGAQRSEHLAACPATLVDATGAGDAMLAGYAAGLVRGLDAFTAARYGRAAAAITVESDHTVSPFIDFATLSARVTACRESLTSSRAWRPQMNNFPE